MTTVDHQRFASDPAEFFGGSYSAMHSVAAKDLADLQLAAVQWRLAELMPRLPVLRRLAAETGVSAVEDLNDLAPLLFEHTVYKSYPPTLLEKSRFADLTRWLGRLTTFDLGGVDASECTSIDSWLELLDSTTPLRVAHSSATTGTMSFLPRSTVEWKAMCSALRCGPGASSEADGAPVAAPGDILMPMSRYGRGAIARLPDMVARYWFDDDQSHVHVMHEGRMSSDAAYFAARMRAAEARGELSRLDAGPFIRERAAEMGLYQEQLASGRAAFFDRAIEGLQGKTVWMFGTWSVLYDIACAAAERGVYGVFGEGSVVLTGGGKKGQTVPDGWEDAVKKFAGVQRLQHSYGMTELTGLNLSCTHGSFHIQPWIVPFVLDPDTGRALPRNGVQTGRAGFLDLIAATYWGGFVTGDEVTIHWDTCECGQTTPHLDPHIERYSAKQGGDDRIMCSAADEAHDEALAHLGQQS